MQAIRPALVGAKPHAREHPYLLIGVDEIEVMAFTPGGMLVNGLQKFGFLSHCRTCLSL
jgi:hypothetical protein